MATTSRYPRSTGTPRGQRRRRELLEKVTDDLATNGLVDFSLRRAARAAGTTHKVLLYHFQSVDDLLAEAITALRARRVARATSREAETDGGGLAEFIEPAWQAVIGEESRVLDQAIGLVLYDTERYAPLAKDASAEYLPALIERCPASWSEEHKRDVAHLVLAALRGFLIERATTGDESGIQGGLRALRRLLALEESSPA
jgi:AcrR family transcriptional regulator